MNQAICTRCSAHFSYSPEDRSGKFCTFECWTKYRVENRKYKSVTLNGYTRMLYTITCMNCHVEKDAVRKTAKYCSAKCQVEYEYKNGLRDKATIAKAANEAVRLNGQPKMRGVKRGSPPQEICDKISRTKFERHAAYRKQHGLPEPRLAIELRGSRQWRAWRLAVFERDHYACVQCGDKRGGNLEADHIKPRYLYPELTFEVDNGRTLCKPCHKATPTYGAKVKLLKRED